jgi:hypothetical protein
MATPYFTTYSVTRRVAWALLCASACCSFSQNARRPPENIAIWTPPSAVDFPNSMKATVPGEMITSLNVSGLPVVLEESELEMVRKHAGGTIGHSGDAGDALSWLCYHGTDPQGDWVLWLMSSEIDGGAVGGFRWQRVRHAADVDGKCQTLPEGRSSVQLPVALQFGIAEAAVLDALGQPSSKLGNVLLYLHEHEVTIHNTPYTAMNTVAVILQGRVVWAIEVWKATTS